MKKFIALFLAVLMISGCFISCKKEDEAPTDEELITERIETFLTAYNTGDMEAVLECLDAKTRNTFQAMLNLLGGLAGGAAEFDIDLADLFSLGVGITQGDFMGLEIMDIKVIDSSSAIATTSMRLTGAGVHTIYFEMVYENNGWYIHDMSDCKPGKLENDQDDEDEFESEDSINNSESDYKISYRGEFVDGRAWVKYYKQNEDRYATNTYYHGFIDKQGNVLYSVLADNVNVFNIGKGSGIVSSETGLILINEDGEVKMNLDGSAEIKFYGEGFAWIYQNKSTITSIEHLYGVVNHAGEWIEPLQNLQKEDLYDDMKYIGDGFVGAVGRDSVLYPIWNADKSIKITIDGYFSDRHITFKNGFAFVNSSHYWGHDGISITVIKTSANGTEETIIYDDIRFDCMICTDGRVLVMESYIPFLNGDKAFYDGKVVRNVIDLENGVMKPYYQITDYTKSTPITAEITAYPASQIEDFVFNGDYGLVQIRGLDKEVYVTMIDLQGNELITPIKGMELNKFVLAPDGYVYYKKDDVYHVVDKNNNVAVTDISMQVSFYDEVGMVSWYGDIKNYIKPNGDILFENLKVK